MSGPTRAHRAAARTLIVGTVGGLLVVAGAAAAAPAPTPAPSTALTTAPTPASTLAPATPPTTGVIKGQVALSSFPTPPSSVRVTGQGPAVAEAELSGDGQFSLTVPNGQGYRIELVSGNDTYTLIFPRGSPQFDSTFDVAGATQPFDVGLVQFVSAPTPESFVVDHWDPLKNTESTPCAFGKICVDDIEASEDVCGPPQVAQSAANTPAAPQGAASTPPAPGGTTPGPVAVAEHNLPSSFGCAGSP